MFSPLNVGRQPRNSSCVGPLRTVFTDRDKPVGLGKGEWTEQDRVEALATRVLVNAEWMYRELPADSPERNYVYRLVESNFTRNHLLFTRVWEDRKNRFTPDFVEWVDENVVNER